MEPLYKDSQIDDGGSLWGIFNNTRQMTCSLEGYLLTIARTDHRFLDDMSAEEEGRFWDFTFTSAAKGLHDSAHRGSEKFPPLKDAEECSVIIAMNDGIAAYQNVGTAHAHVIWVPENNEIGDLQKRLIDDRTIITGSATPYLPAASADIILTPKTYAQDIRAARQTLREQFKDNAGDIGFSLYTKEACMTDPRNGGHMVIEAWTPDHTSVSTLSQFVRSWNKLWDSPATPGGIGMKYSGFIRN